MRYKDREKKRGEARQKHCQYHSREEGKKEEEEEEARKERSRILLKIRCDFFSYGLSYTNIHTKLKYANLICVECNIVHLTITRILFH